MKANTSIFIVTAITLIGVVGAIWFATRPAEVTPSVPTQPDEAEAKNGDGQKKNTNAKGPPKEEEHDGDKLSEFMDLMTEEEKALRPEGMSDKEWVRLYVWYREGVADNGTVEFYGKIVDANGAPLAGVELVAEISYNEPSLASALEENGNKRKEEMSITSAADGTFSIVEPVGRSMFLKNFAKNEYKISGKKSYAYMFSPASSKLHTADPKNPEIFTMEKAP